MNHPTVRLLLVVCCLAGCKKPAVVEAEVPAANPGSVAMSPEALEAAGVVTAPAATGKLVVEDELPGTIEAPGDALVIVNTPAPGVVDALDADVGDAVTAGKRLASVRSAELARAQGEYRRNVANEQHAAAALKRSEALLADGLISARRVEADRLAWKGAQLAVEETTQNVTILGGSLKDATGTISVSAPISGTVASRTANRGEAVAENAPLFTVVDVSRVVVQLRAPGGVPVAPGARATFTVEALPGRTFAATVKSASDVIDAETRKFLIRCTVDNADHVLKPGMFVSAKLPRVQETTVVVPESAVLEMEGGSAVFVANTRGTFEKRSVVVGARANGQVAVLSGLADQEQVVTHGAYWVRTRLQKSELEE